ncbi:kinase-like domain-containing protein [Blastocladiella britannica]|nr:kinase-like domain-containing protein [Blastocladiella britannica]
MPVAASNSAVKGNDIKKAGGEVSKPDAKAKVQKEGWLTKRGEYIRNWRPRWVQLVDSILYYYKEPSHESEATNYFLLASAKCQANDRMGTNCFELILANGERRYMSAATKEERDDWVVAINQAIAGRARSSSIKAGDGAADSAAAAAAASAAAAATRSIAAGGDDETVADRDGKKRFRSPDDLVFHKVLGKGNYGKVMLATAKNGPQTEYFAVKVIKKSSLLDEESIEHVLAENRVLQTLSHPFLVKLHASFQTPDRLYFVMEYVRGGEIFFHIVKERKFAEERVRLYVAEILLALQYLHSKGIVYRDLKLENLLIDDAGHVKITDFGLCKEGIGQGDTTSTFCGTPEYLAPEILEEENYGKSVDWWALGIVTYEMLVGKPPFGSPESVEKLFQAILHRPIDYPSTLSPNAKALLQALLCRDYKSRLGCGETDGEEIMHHAWFEGIDWDALKDRKIAMPFKPKVDGAGDTGNFDKDFTDMPVNLTPSNSMPDLAGLELAVTKK